MRHEKRRQEKGAHVCTKMYIHRDFYDRTLAPKREIDVLRAISPAGIRAPSKRVIRLSGNDARYAEIALANFCDH